MKTLKQLLLGAVLAVISYILALGLLMGVTTILLAMPANATELQHQFKNPSFSGNGAGAQWLTIENQEFSRKKAIQDKIEADLKTAANEEKNSILNKFMTNLQSRIYSQLAKQLTDNLFGNSSATEGEFELDGNMISFMKGLDGITLKITEPNGNTTEIVIPTTGSFKF